MEILKIGQLNINSLSTSVLKGEHFAHAQAKLLPGERLLEKGRVLINLKLLTLGVVSPNGSHSDTQQHRRLFVSFLTQ